MTDRPWYWTRQAVAVVGLIALLVAGTGDASAQAEVAALCSGAPAPLECNLAASVIQHVQPRVGLALWGGNPVPGTASTAGFRLGKTPRIGISGRMALVPAVLPPLLDRGRDGSSTTVVTSLALQSSVPLLHGVSPLPTVGGILSVDLLARLSHGWLARGKGFENGGVWGYAAGLRLGLLRESFTLPGLSVTFLYGRSTDVKFGDPDGVEDDGFARGAVSDLAITAAASRYLFGFRLAGGVSWDRYGTDARVGYPGAPPAGGLRGDLTMDRWSAFASITWTRLIYHAVLEVGSQEKPTLPTLPAGVDVGSWGAWVALAFRVTP